MKISHGFLALTLIALPACNNDSLIPVCRKAPNPIYFVLARDSATKAVLKPNFALSGRIVDGTFTGVLTAFNDSGALEFLGTDRPGTYDVFVSATGYKEWKKSGVAFVLGTDNCGSVPVSDTANLVKSTQ